MAGLTASVLAGSTWVAIDTWWLRRQRPAATVTALYRRLRRQTHRLAVPMRVSDTPYEFVAAFTKRAADLSREESWDEWLLPVVQNARHLADCYVQAIYAPRPLSLIDQRRAIQTWQRLRWHLWRPQVRRSRLFGRRRFD
jgi:hypothetical protein